MDFADRDAAMVWIIRNQFGRRNLAPFTRVELALRLEETLKAQAKTNQGTRTDKGKNLPQKSSESSPPAERETRQQLAKVAGVSHDTIAKGKLVAQHADEETKHRLRTNQISVHRVAKDIKEKIQREERQERRVEAAKAAPKMDSRIIVGDFRKHADKVADGTVSLIFTDPPYDREASKMLPALGEFAKSKLRAMRLHRLGRGRGHHRGMAGGSVVAEVRGEQSAVLSALPLVEVGLFVSGCH